MNYKNLCLFCIFLELILLSKSLTDDEASARIDRLLMVSLFSWRNLNSFKSDGTCAKPKYDKCQNISNEINLIRKDIDGRRIVSYIYSSYAETNSFSGNNINSFSIDSSTQLTFDVEHVEQFKKFLIDDWIGINTKIIGIYRYNQVLGIFGITTLGLTFNLRARDKKLVFSTMLITVDSIHWINYKYSNGDACCIDDAGNACLNACPFIIAASINDKVIWKSGARSYKGSDSDFIVRLIGGTDDDSIRAKNISLHIDLYDSKDSSKIIDTLNLKNINIDNEDRILQLNKITGDFGNVQLDVEIKYNCNGFVGVNCEFRCESNDSTTDCNPLTGELNCLNGALDIPTCSKFNNICKSGICQNGAACIENDMGYFCNCEKGFNGRHCEKKNCKDVCFGGVCDMDNNCICKEGYVGKLCEISFCSKEESLLCLNGGNCTKFLDVVKCECPTYVEGSTCATPKCTPECKKGVCVLNSKKSKPTVECQCDSDYTGNSCAEYSKYPYIITAGPYIYVIAALCIFLLVAIKFMILMVLNPIISKLEQNTTSLTERRGSSVSEL